MESEKLPNAPLQEVIFEVRWELEPTADGRPWVDPNFSFALGKFQDLIREQYAHTVHRFPPDVPHQFLPHQAMVQFWKAKNLWPVLQLGPGLFTVNETEKNYQWSESFLPLVKQSLELLDQSYEGLQYSFASLRYVDAVKVEDYHFESWESFVGRYLKIQWANNFQKPGPARTFQLDQNFEIEGLGTLNLNLSSGENPLQEKTFNWQTAVFAHRDWNLQELMAWLEDAHRQTSRNFKEICSDEFYRSFFD